VVKISNTKSNTPWLSIITINLNNGAGLQKTLASIQAQSWRNFESVIIDGGSTDESVAIINNFSSNSKCNISKWVSEKDNGLYHAQNKGIRAARGEYLLFLNSGDYLCSEKTLENLYPEKWKSEIIYGNVLVENGKRRSATRMPPKISAEHLYYSTLMHPATFIRRNLFKKVGMYREDFKICSDYYFFVKALVRHKIVPEYRMDVISVFDGGGLSSSVKYRQIHHRERQQTIIEFFTPEMLNEVIIQLQRRTNSLRFAILALPRYFYRAFLKRG
jgi:glycosyltransferase involved in cell wall biosynthesis